MRYTTTVLVALAAVGSLEFFAAGTPTASVQIAQAQDLGPSLQFKLKKLATTINKTRSSLASQGAAAVTDDFKAKQWQQRIDSYKSGLSRYPANTDATFAAAKAELTALEQEFAALKGGAAAAPAPAQTTGTTAPAAPVQSGLDSSARIKLSGLMGNMERTKKLLLRNGAQTLQTADGQAKLKKDLTEYTTALNNYKAQASDPLVQQAVAAYKDLRATAGAVYEESKKAKAAGDNAQAEIEALREEMIENKAPGVLYVPFNDSEAKAWVDRARAVKANSARIETEAVRIGTENSERLDQKSHSSIQSIRIWVRDQSRNTDEVIQQTESNLNAGFQMQDQHGLKYFRELDPENPNHKANAFLKEGAEQEMYARLDHQIALATAYAAYDKAKNGTVSDDKQARLDETLRLREEYGEKRIKAVGDSKLPEPKSTDADMLAIAKDVIEKPKYEFGEHGPIILTTPEIVTREKTVSRDTIKDVDVSLSGDITWSGTRETWEYKWDEFRFATPLKEENGDWYIWWITAKNFKSGASSTPLNQWISGVATKGSLILEKNIK